MRLAHFQLAGAMALVGSALVVGKAAAAYMPVLVFLFARFIVACVALAPFALREPGPRFAALTLRDWRDIFLQALFGTLGYTVFLLYGLQFTSAINAGIITSTVPAAIAGLAVVILGERIGMRSVFALALAVIGIAAVNTASAQPSVASHPLLGNTLIAGAVLCEGLFAIAAKRTAARLPIYRMALAVNALGFLLIGPLCIVGVMNFDLTTVPLWAWMLPAYYALTSAVIALVLWYRGMAALPASEAAIFTSTFPLTAVALSLILLGETLHWAHGLGLVCVLAAIYLGATTEGKAKRPAASA